MSRTFFGPNKSRRSHRAGVKQAPKTLHVGPGGTACTCCFPAPGSKERRLEFRAAKRREKLEAFRIESFQQ